MKTLVARNLPTQLVLELGQKIIGGSIPPGTILTSDTLEAQFGVSRTVVREALKVLHDKGLTRARTKTGTIVWNAKSGTCWTQMLLLGFAHPVWRLSY